MSYSDTWIVFDNDLNNLRNALQGNLVVTRMAVSQRAAGANMSVDIESGDCIAYGTYRTFYATSNVTVAAAHATLPRKDLVCVNTSGTIVSSGADANCKGTAEAAAPGGSTGPVTTAPKPPNIPANYLLLAEIWVPAAAGSIVDANITDRRILGPQIFPDNMGDVHNQGTLATQAGYMRDGYFYFCLGDNMRLSADLGGFNRVTACCDTQPLRGYGTYQAATRETGWEMGKSVSHLAIWWHYRCSYMGLYFIHQTVTGPLEKHRTVTGKNASMEIQDVAGWTPANETTLKMEWTPTSVKFYVGGALKNTHATEVPNKPGHLGWEIDHLQKATDYTSISELYFKDFARIA